MASKKKADKDPAKTTDLPPYGSRNPDPLTDSPGSHPIETGIGAVIGGAASGIALGAVGGPIGAVVGAIVGGAAAGGLAGKGVGELIDPTTEDNWLHDYFGESKDRPENHTPDTYRPAYHYGLESRQQYGERSFDEAETELRDRWEREHSSTGGLGWNHARGAVRHAFDRAGGARGATSPGTADAGTPLHGQSRPVTVPVQREEVVVDRRPHSGPGVVATDFRTEDVTLPAAPTRPSDSASEFSGLGTGIETPSVGSGTPAGRETADDVSVGKRGRGKKKS